ncbi:hypothetical protein GCM10027569_44980 [Flindersiella endophytica]
MATIQAAVLTAVLAVAVLLVASCGRDVATLEATPGPSDPATSTPTTTGPPMTERPSLPSKKPRDPNVKRTYVIKSANVDKRDARKVEVTYEVPTPCSPALDRAAVVEEPASVVVTLHARQVNTKDQPMCAQVIQERTTTVTLDEPLANRKLIDGATGVTVVG